MSSKTLKRYLSENPRMLGVAFMITVLLAQAGNTTAACNSTWCGP